MSKTKKVLLMCTAYVLVAALAIGGTIAYLTSKDSDVNVMTMGNVEIEQIEQQYDENGNLVDFEQDKPLYPYVGTLGWKNTENANGAYRQFTMNNVVDKYVSVKNTGKSDAYVRTLIALEMGSFTSDEFNKIGISINSENGSEFKFPGAWNVVNDFVEEIEGYKYNVMEFVHSAPVKPGETTVPSLLQVYLSKDATNEDVAKLDGNGNGKYDILVLSQATQTAGFADAKTALNAGFGEVNAQNAAEWFGGIKSKDFVPANAVKIDSTITHDNFAALLAAGKNIYLTESVVIANPESSRFTEFDVNGEVGIWAAEGATLTFSETTGITGDGVLTVYSGSIDEKQELWVGATLIFEGGEHTFAALSVSGDGKIVVNDGTLNCKGTYAGIMGITFGENGNLVVNGGKINLYQPINLNPNRCDAAYVEINGGTVELLNGIENLFVVRNIMDKDKAAGGVLRGSSIRITGGTFIAHYEIDSAGDATSFIRNGDGPADGNKVLVSSADGYNCVVTGGTFYGSWQRADNTRYTDGNGGYADGKMVDNSIKGFVVNGYKITGDATNGYVVSAN